jgi:antitoxin component HigA of HigAB toxin-antitoxin module
MRNLKPIKTRADYAAAIAEMKRLWGAKSGTPQGDRLDILATLVDTYEARHFRVFADGLVVMTYVEGEPPETEADWRRVADTRSASCIG